MSQNKKLILGLVGFGTVGGGLFEALQRTKSLDAVIRRICIKDPRKQRAAPAELFTTDFKELLDDEGINVIVELIDDAEAAYHIVTSSLKRGKAVVSANKKMIAAHLDELIYLQRTYNAPLLYEASCCAGIPVIRNLEEYYDNDLLTRISGIINGSSNYILTKIEEENIDFADALKLAQEAGFAESDPSLDVEGKDSVNKLCILAAHAFGEIVDPQQVAHQGITEVTNADIQLAKARDCSIRLIASAERGSDGRLNLTVRPETVHKDSELGLVKNEFNALETESCFADKHFFKGRGAGAFPTAAAVLSDISALRYGYKYEYKKLRERQVNDLQALTCSS